MDQYGGMSASEFKRLRDDSAKKVIYPVPREASQKWTMSVRHWKVALNRFTIEFQDRLIDYV